MRGKGEIVCTMCRGSGRMKLKRKRPKRYGPCCYCKGTGRRNHLEPTASVPIEIPELTPWYTKIFFTGETKQP